MPAREERRSETQRLRIKRRGYALSFRIVRFFADLQVTAFAPASISGAILSSISRDSFVFSSTCLSADARSCFAR